MASVNDTLITAMQEIAQTAVDSAGYDKTRTCVIMSTANTNNTYTISMDGVTYENIPCCGGGSFSIGDVAKLYIPNNQMSQAYLEKYPTYTPTASFQFPVGYVFEWSASGTVTSAPDLTTPAKVATYFGYGTWELFGVGKVMVGLDEDDTSFDTDGETGGSKNAIVVSHTHTQASHSHDLSNHTHTGGSHTHGLNSHTHGLNSHTHSLNSHTHTINHGHTFTQPSVSGGTCSISSSGAHTHTAKVLPNSASGSNYNLPSGGGTSTTTSLITSSGDHTHTVPNHTHTVSGGAVGDYSGSTGSPSTSNTGSPNQTNTGGATGDTGSGGAVSTGTPSTNSTSSQTPSIESTGSDGTGANLQPYITVYRYRRIA